MRLPWIFANAYGTGSSKPNGFAKREAIFTSMIGPLVAGKKAAKFGYKRYGLSGAVVAGTGAAVGTAIGVKKITSDVRKKNKS